MTPPRSDHLGGFHVVHNYSIPVAKVSRVASQLVAALFHHGRGRGSKLCNGDQYLKSFADGTGKSDNISSTTSPCRLL